MLHMRMCECIIWLVVCLQNVAGNGKVTELTSAVQDVSSLVSIAEEAAEECRQGQDIASSSARSVVS